MADMPPYPGAPRWAKLSAIVTAILAALLAAMLATGAGGHGPAAHGSPEEMGGHGRWGLPILLALLLLGSMSLNSRWLVGRTSRYRALVGSLPAPWRKVVLLAHVATSVSALGAVAVFLVLAITGVASQAAESVRTAYVANALIAWYVILPLLLASLAIGIGQALATPWGVFRHCWVIAKLALTVATIYVLFQQMQGISYLAEIATTTTLSSTDLVGLRHSVQIHAAGGLVVLLLITALSIFKPRGLTRYGWYKQYEDA